MYASIVWYVCAVRKCVPTISDPLGQNMSQHSMVLLNYSMGGGNGTEVDMHQKKNGGEGTAYKIYTHIRKGWEQNTWHTLDTQEGKAWHVIDTHT